jgi:hypothetical protein
MAERSLESLERLAVVWIDHPVTLVLAWLERSFDTVLGAVVAVFAAAAAVFAAVAAAFAAVVAYSARAYSLCRGWLQRMHNNIRSVGQSRPCSYWVFVAWIYVTFAISTAPLVARGLVLEGWVDWLRVLLLLGGVNVLGPAVAGYIVGYRWPDSVRETFSRRIDAVLADLRYGRSSRTSSGDSKAFEAEPPIEYKCPISCDIMVDPVVASDGWTYDRACIESWLRGLHDVDAVGPEQPNPSRL